MIFLADRTNGTRAYAAVFANRLSVCCLCDVLCIVAKRCVLEQTLLWQPVWSRRIDWY